jgi:hypothetical protein
MQYSLSNLPPSIAHYAQQNQQPQHPHQNFVVPDKRTINRLKRIFAYYDKLPKSAPFNYGTSSSYRKKPTPPALMGQPPEFNRIDDLPLFEKR